MRQYNSEAATEGISSKIIISELEKIWRETTSKFSKILMKGFTSSKPGGNIPIPS